MCSYFLVKILKVDRIIIFGIIGFSLYQPLFSQSFFLNQLVYIEKISSFQEPQGKCNLESEKISIPSSVNRVEEWRNSEYLNYCFEIKLPQELLNLELGLSLGYIDNLYRIYWNKTLIGSTEERESQITLFYDEPVVLKVPKFLTHNVNNIIEIQIHKNTKSISGGGISGGILEISPYLTMKRKAFLYKYYNFGKVILFISTAILFIILYLSRKKELEYLFFSLFLFIISFYYTTKLEIKYELELDTIILKKMEYLSFSLIIPSFTHFLFKLLKISRRNPLLYFITFFGFIYHGIFWFLQDIHEIENFNYLYHVPFLLISICFLFIVIIHQIINKNKRALPVLFVVGLPLFVSLLQISNVRFGFLPFISGLLLGGDAILILVIFMAAYIGGQFYFLQKKLDYTVQKEETLRKTFQLYVPPKDIEKILNSFNEEMERTNIGTLEEKTILFCDIRDFTTISEKMNPSEIVKFLNNYFERFNTVIVNNGGVIDKLMGDCIMARFDYGKEMYAIKAALEIQEELQSYNKVRMKLRQKPIGNGVGLSLGEVVLGNIGSRNKMDFTVIGDPVNVASRLESLTKFYNIPILVNESLYKRTNEFVLYREIDTIIIKGKRKPSRIYQPLEISSYEWDTEE